MNLRFSHFALFSCVLLFSCSHKNFEKIDNGIVVNIPQKSELDVNKVKLEVLGDKLIKVSATPEDKFSDRKSLICSSVGEVFVFDMGKPVKIADLAKRMIMLSGAENIEIKYTGLRAGEKLYEEVLSELEDTKPSFHEKIRIACVREYEYEQVCEDIDELVEISKTYDDMRIVAKMKQIVPEYKSNNSVYTKLD